jgi:hypothetical protein
MRRPERLNDQKRKPLRGRPPATAGYAAMSRQQLLDECRDLYSREGTTAFTF